MLVRLDYAIDPDPPGRQSNRIDQRDASERASVNEVCTQHRRPAEVVTDDVGSVEVPVVEQLTQQIVLDPERDILAVTLLRPAVADQVVDEHLPPGDQVRDDPVPD